MTRPPRFFLAMLAIASLPAFAPAVAAVRAAPIESRLASCDPAVVDRAVQDALRDPAVLRQPITLFLAAQAQAMRGKKEDAAFLYLAARLRTVRQTLFEKGDVPQLLAVMEMSIGPLAMPVLLADPVLARRLVGRTMEWDRATPDPFRDDRRAREGTFPKKLAEIDASLAALPDTLQAQARSTGMARDTQAQAASQLAAMRAERCGAR
jgi:hypothetical protein